MSSASDKSLGIDIFERLIRDGNYTGFLTGMESLDQSTAVWDTAQVLKLEVLQLCGQGKQAWQLAAALRKQITDPALQRQATLTFLYLDWLFNGRKEIQSRAIDKACKETLSQPTPGKLFPDIREIQLKLSATEVMLGLVDARLKSTLVEEYRQVIHSYLEARCFQRAFLCVLQLVKLQLSRPLFSKASVLGMLKQYEREPFVKTVPFRLASIRALIAEILLEDALKGVGNDSHEGYYQSAVRLFTRCHHKEGQLKLLMVKGRLLLQYGHAHGKVLLDRAIRGFESINNSSGQIQACTAIIMWLQSTGRLSAIATYQHRICENEPLVGKASKQTLQHNTEEQDLAFRSMHCINQAEGMAATGDSTAAQRLLRQTITAAQSYGDTLPLAHLYAALSLHTEIKSESTRLSKTALRLYVNLGYHEEALDFIRKQMLHCCAKPEEATDIAIESWLGQAQSLISGRPTLTFAEKLAACHEVAAGFYLNSGNREKAFLRLRRAAGLYTEYDLKPLLAFNLMYQGLYCLEMGGSAHLPEAAELLTESQALFRLIHYPAGIWFTELALTEGKNLDKAVPLFEIQKYRKRAEELFKGLDAMSFRKFSNHLQTSPHTSAICQKLLQEHKPKPVQPRPISTHLRDH